MQKLDLMLHRLKYYRPGKLTISISVIILAVIFMSVQLMRYAKDTSLSDWQEGFEGYIYSLNLQQDSNKPIAAFFYTDWCNNCEEFRENVLSNWKVKSLINQLHPIKINPESGFLENQLASEFGVFAYPTFYIIPPNQTEGILIKSSGQTSPEEFLRQVRSALI